MNTTGAACSVITRIEVLGYHKMSSKTTEFFIALFENIIVIPINDAIVEKAIALKQVKPLSLGDSIIASTALVHSIPLATNNVKNFQWIEGIGIINPVDRV